MGTCVLGLWLAFTLWTPPAQAQTVAETPADRRLEVRKLDILGVSGLDASQITGVLATRKSGGMLPFLGRDRYFDARQLQSDLYRIIAFLSDNGWPHARVTSVDIERDERAKAVDITIHVEQGAPVIIDSVQTYGFDVLSPADQEAVQQRVTLAAGRRRVQGDVRTTRTATLAVLQERGYAYANVHVLEGESSAPGHVSLFVIAEPGPASTFGRITVRGNERVSDGRVKSLLGMKEGQQFRISRVADTQRRLYNREIFQFVSVNADTSGPVGAPVPVEVVLTQAKPRRLSITPGYGSEEKARITTTLRHLNFFGGARTAQTTFRWSSLDRGFRANIEEPSLFRRGVSMSVGGQYWYANEPAYELTTKGGRVTFAKARERSDPVRRRQSITTASVTFVNELEQDREALLWYKQFREEAERKGFRHFLEVFDPNVDSGIPPEKLGEFINDNILRTLAGVPESGRPMFLKIVYHGPKAMEELAQYDPNLVVGILGGSAGTTYDAFRLIHDAQKYGARVALFGRKINNAEHQLAFIEMLRMITDGKVGPEEAVRAYHGVLQARGIRPHRPLE